MKTGIERIALERQRQVEQEGWSPEHDDAHADGELVEAAECYLETAMLQALDVYIDKKPDGWPWSPDWWKPSEDPIRNLEKAGALIAAEIDRVHRAKERAEVECENAE